MVRRKLTETEKKIVNKSLGLLDEETKDAEYMVKYYTLMIDEGVEINVKRQLREYGAKLREVKNVLEVNKSTVKILKEQLVKGVEIKKIKEVK